MPNGIGGAAGIIPLPATAAVVLGCPPKPAVAARPAGIGGGASRFCGTTVPGGSGGGGGGMFAMFAAGNIHTQIGLMLLVALRNSARWQNLAVTLSVVTFFLRR